MTSISRDCASRFPARTSPRGRVISPLSAMVTTFARLGSERTGVVAYLCDYRMGAEGRENQAREFVPKLSKVPLWKDRNFRSKDHFKCLYTDGAVCARVR